MFSSRSALGDRRSTPGDSLPRSYSRPRAAPPPEAISFFAGQRVRHATFGEGLVVSSRLVDGDEEVTVSFADRERRLLATFARLERIEG